MHSLNGVRLGLACQRHGSAQRRRQSGDAARVYVHPGAEWEWSRSGPTLVDLDADGARDIVFGTRNDSGTKRLMALRHDGTSQAGTPA